MGNSLSQEEISERTEYLTKILSLKFDRLDIGNRIGSTDYLDFITPEELNSHNVMSGYDFASRPFFVFKAEIEFDTGRKLKTFSTFFQRYADNDLTWHICGHYGRNIMCTCGGSNNDQIKMLYELLSTGHYKLDKLDNDKLDNLSLDYKYDLIKDDGNNNELEIPIEIRIGYSM